MAVECRVYVRLPSSVMASALTTIYISIRYTFAIVFARVWITSFNLIISRSQFISIIEIYNNKNHNRSLMWCTMYRHILFIYRVALGCLRLN